MRHFISDHTKKEAVVLASAFVGFFVFYGIVFLLRYFILNDFSALSSARRDDIVFEGGIIVLVGIGVVFLSYYHLRFAYATWEICPTGILVRYFFSSREYLWNDLPQIIVCKIIGKGTKEISVICCCTDSSIDMHPTKGSTKKPSWRSTDYVIYHPKKILALPYSEDLAEEIKRFAPQLRYLYEV